MKVRLNPKPPGRPVVHQFATTPSPGQYVQIGGQVYRIRNFMWTPETHGEDGYCNIVLTDPPERVRR